MKTKVVEWKEERAHCDRANDTEARGKKEENHHQSPQSVAIRVGESSQAQWKLYNKIMEKKKSNEIAKKPCPSRPCRFSFSHSFKQHDEFRQQLHTRASFYTPFPLKSTSVPIRECFVQNRESARQDGMGKIQDTEGKTSRQAENKREKHNFSSNRWN